jgi:hypothetical protein
MHLLMSVACEEYVNRYILLCLDNESIFVIVIAVSIDVNVINKPHLSH